MNGDATIARPGGQPINLQDMDAATEPYNEVVRQYFAEPLHAGDLRGEHLRTVAASAAEAENGIRVSMEVGLDERLIAEMAFRAWACPHLIAAAELVCRQMEGQSASALGKFDATKVRQVLSIPLEKTGRIMLLEDLLSTLSRQLSNSG